MSLHMHDVTQRLARYLDRRAVPARLRDKPQAQQDEARAIAEAIARIAPAGRLHDWWPKFEDNLADAMDNTGWPSERTFRDCARSASEWLRQTAPKKSADGLTDAQGDVVEWACETGRLIRATAIQAVRESAHIDLPRWMGHDPSEAQRAVYAVRAHPAYQKPVEVKTEKRRKQWGSDE